MCLFLIRRIVSSCYGIIMACVFIKSKPINSLYFSQYKIMLKASTNWELLHGLSYTQICHDFFCSTKNSSKLEQSISVCTSSYKSLYQCITL